jgi:hypothetical protein
MVRITSLSSPSTMMSSPSSADKGENRKRKREKTKYTTSSVSVEPIAYIVKLKLNKKTSRYIMSPLNDEHAEYVKKNKKEILIDFLGRQGIPAEKYKFEYI